MSFYTMPDGEKLFVRKFGKGQPVLVLSGLGMLSWQWIPYLLTQSKQYQFIIPDWRGFGGSKSAKIPVHLNAIQSHWLDTSALIDQLQLNQFKLIAYSMGATTAMHGMQYGNLSEKLQAYLHIDQTPKITSDDLWEFGLLGQNHHHVKDLLQQLSNLLHQFSDYQTVSDLPSEIRHQLIQKWLVFVKLQGNNKIGSIIFELAMKNPKLNKHILPIQRLDYLIWYVDNYLNHQEDYRSAISALNCATTFFIGEKSNLYPSIGQIQIAESLKKSEKIIFKRSGHAPLISEPIKFSREIGVFLNKRSL